MDDHQSRPTDGRRRRQSIARLLPGLPTSREDWRLVGRTVRLVLSIPAYAAVAVVGTVLALSAFALVQNATLATFALTGSGLSAADRLTVLLDTYPFVGSAFDPLASLALTGTAVLAGVDLAMVAYHVREHGLAVREGGGGALGLVLGGLGAGCAACGSALLVGLLSLAGASGAVTLLPLEGLEVAILAGGTLVLSIYWVADGLRGGRVNGCPVDL